MTAPVRMGPSPTGGGPDPSPSFLTERETQVLLGAANGLTNAQVGNRLGIAENTVKSHMASALRHLAASSRGHAVAIALSLDLIGGHDIDVPRHLRYRLSGDDA